MKSLLHSSVSKTVLLLVSLGSFFGSLAMTEAGASHPLFVGAVHFGAPDHRPGSAEGYLLVNSATDPFENGELCVRVDYRVLRVSCQRFVIF
jgi:hypothetical protein